MNPSLWRCLAPLVLLLLGWHPLRADNPEARAVDALIKDTLKAWQVPGTAVVVVRNDKVLYLQGQGVKELGRPDAVTPDTLFGIGSCTKAIAATAIGMLIDEGKMTWDDPVRKHLATFHLKDALADRDITLRDLLCHRSGLARHDELWQHAPWSLEETVRRMAALDPSHSFRARYEHCNLGYITAGLAVGLAAGMPWHEYVKKRLFAPLEMKNVVFTRTEALKAPDHATPHQRTRTGKIERIPWYDDDQQIRASGSVKAGVRDLAAWIRFQLNEGAYNGKQLLTLRTFQETHRPQIVVPTTPTMVREEERTQSSYGLGWHIHDYRGHLLVEHGGAVEGFRARLILVPRARLGIAVLVNLGGSDMPEALGRNLVDLYLGLKKKDWNAIYQHQAEENRTAQEKRTKEFLAKRQPGTKPSRALETYAGTYVHPAYGKATIALRGATLVLTWANAELPLKHFHYDTFLGEAPARFADRPVAFTLDASGTPARLRFLEQDFVRLEEKKERE